MSTGFYVVLGAACLLAPFAVALFFREGDIEAPPYELPDRVTGDLTDEECAS